MLANLKIENIAIIENASIDFDNGLNVMSGETGAGKSIILDSLGAILGHRTSKDLVRTGETKAKVSAIFTDVNENVINKLKEYDIDIEEDYSLLIQRLINIEGKNICKINNCPVTVSMLKNIGKELIDIHGQNDSQNLLNQERHIDFIDAIANVQEMHNEYINAFEKLKNIRKKIVNLNTNEDEKLRKVDLLKFQIDELELANIQTGEKEELLKKKKTYQNSEKILTSLNDSIDILSGSMDSEGINSLVSQVADNLENASNYVDSLSEIASKIRDISYNLEEYSSDIRSCLVEYEFNPNEIDDTEERLDTLYKLSLKYGNTEEEMLEYLSSAKNELDDIIFSDEKIKKLKLDLRIAETKANELANKLSNLRHEFANEFENQVKNELKFLDMPLIEFKVRQDKTELNENGCDIIEFLISANVGESVKPLAKIASGGELSRIMLAIKNVLSENDKIDTLIFDEIDTGVSGSASQKIAIKLSQVAKGRQVICVTHGAQIASYANNHLLIEKQVKNNKTYTQVKSLDINGRINEIARIIGGINISQLQLQNAKEMLSASNVLQEEIKK